MAARGLLAAMILFGLDLQDGRVRTLAAVIAAMLVVHLIFSLTTPLLALTLEREGISTALIGLSTMVPAFAAFAIAPLAPVLLERVGPKRLMLTALLIAAVTLLLTKLWVNFWFWIPLRFLMGAAGASLWIASEAWINALAEDRTRGRIIGIYGTAGGLGLAAGPLVLALVGSESWAPFLIAAGLILLGALPLAAPRAALPDFKSRGGQRGIWRFFVLAPVPILLNFLIASGEESMLAFLPLYGRGLGLPEAEALWLMTLFAMGIVCLQAPIGWLADRVSKAGLLAVMLLASLGVVLAHPWFLPVTGLNQLIYFLYGGCFSSMYIIAMMLIGQRFKGADLARASAAFSMMWGIGSSVGPPVVGAVMDLLPGGQGYVAAQAGLILAVLWVPLLLRRG